MSLQKNALVFHPQKLHSALQVVKKDGSYCCCNAIAEAFSDC